MKRISSENVKHPHEGMTSTYNSQSENIVSGHKTILQLQYTEPYLFYCEGVVAHYNELNTCDLEQNVHDSMEKKIGPFAKFLGQQKCCTTIYENILEQDVSDCNQTCHMIGIILMVMAEFKEDANIIFVIPQVSISLPLSVPLSLPLSVTSHIHDRYLYWI